MPKHYEIMCPYCFKKSSPEDVVFRASHFIEDDTEYSLRPDEILNRYREELNLGPLYDIETVIDPRNILNENKKYTDGVLVEIIDKYGMPAKKRLCPHCHNELPLTAGRTPSTIISIIGASQVGKSVFMTALIHTLQNFTARNFNAACVPLTYDINQRYKDLYETPIFRNNVLLDPTQKEQRLEPLIFQFKFKNDEKPPVTLSFFDAAGEGMTDQKYLEIYAENIRNSSGILFLVDPLQIGSIREKISMNSNYQLGDFTNVYAEPQDVLISLFENFIGNQQNQRTTIPTAIVLTKSDMLSLINDEEYIDENSNMFRSFTHREVFDLNEFENIDGEVRRFIEKVDITFKNAIDVYFSNVGSFAVSALGSNPVDRRIEGVVSPVRVDEPFLWLLHKLNYIDGRR
jgi:hypothetical protein